MKRMRLMLTLSGSLWKPVDKSAGNVTCLDSRTPRGRYRTHGTENRMDAGAGGLLVVVAVGNGTQMIERIASCSPCCAQALVQAFGGREALRWDACVNDLEQNAGTFADSGPCA